MGYKPNKEFKCGDRVALSATFLRAMCPNAAKGWPTTIDLGKGTVINVVNCAGTFLIDVWFDRNLYRRYNAFNLVHAKDVYLDAMRAEHNRRDAQL